MARCPIRASALGHAGCQALHAASLEVLEKVGAEVQHQKALDMLVKAGASVEGSRARIPAPLVDEALRSAPRSVVLRSRSAQPPLDLRQGVTYYGTGSDCLYLLGPGARDRRSVSLADVEEMAALQELLPNIDFVMSMAHPHEFDPVYAPVAQFAAMLRGTSKPLIMVPETATDLALFQEMATVCGGADSWAVYAQPTSPLMHGHASADRLIRCAELGVPMVYASTLLPGATAPASPAACLVVANAEMLSGLVISQLAHCGAPYVYGVSQGAMNLRNASALYCAPEAMAVQQASGDLGRFYGLPTFGYGGCSDAELLDEQWATEAGMTLLGAALSGVTLLHDIGYIASGTAASHESIVVMDELIAWVKAYLNGVTIDNESLAVAEIEAAGPGGSHLARRYSRMHYRDYLIPELISQESHDTWVAGGASSLLQRAAEKAAKLRSGARAYALPADVQRELDAIVAEAQVLSLKL